MGVLLHLVVVDILVPLMIVIALSVSIVVDPIILRISVGILMDVHRIFLHVSSWEVD